MSTQVIKKLNDFQSVKYLYSTLTENEKELIRRDKTSPLFKSLKQIFRHRKAITSDNSDTIKLLNQIVISREE